MSGKRMNVDTLKQIQDLKEKGISKSKAAEIVGVTRETVRRYWDSSSLEDHTPPPTWVQNLDNWDDVVAEAKKVPLTVLYEELKKSYPLPSYQAFCQYLRNHRGSDTKQDVVIRQTRGLGEAIEVDYSGDGWPIFDTDNKELYRAQLFVGTPAYSGYIFAHFTRTQRLEDFILAHVLMFQEIGGVHKFIVPDNCATAVSKTDRYDPKINPTYKDMCGHYGIVVDPADPACPQHKPNAERAVRIVQQGFYPRIRKKKFTSMLELNKELKQWINKANERPIRGRGKSRSYFLDKERPFLSPLPNSKYEVSYFKKAKAHPDCHIQLNKNYYSIPYRYVGKKLDVKFNSRSVHIYYGLDLITTHATAKGTYHRSTKKEHYPSKKYVDTDYHLKLARKKAKDIGENVSILIERLIEEAKHPLKHLRKIQGILGLVKQFSPESLDYGCDMALKSNRMNYDNVKRFAKFYKKPTDSVSGKSPVRQQQFAYLRGGEHDGKARRNKDAGRT